MLMVLIASTIGIILGLHIEFTLCVALLFLLILSCMFFKLNLKKVMIFNVFVITFFVYINIQISMYDNKYIDGFYKDDYKIISNKDETNFYDKYIVKNSKGDKFLIFIKSGTLFKKGEVIHASGNFSLPELSRNSGGFNQRRYLNSQKIYGSIFVDEYYLTDLGKFNLIYYLQDEIYNTLAKLFPKDELGLVLGMMIGETKDISENVLESFKKTRYYSFSSGFWFKCNVCIDSCAICF